MPGTAHPDDAGAVAFVNPIVRVADDALSVLLPPELHAVIGRCAEVVRACAVSPGSAAHGRLFSPIDESADQQDPLLTFERQWRMDGVSEIVLASYGKSRISVEEAEAWMAVLGMATAMEASELGINEDADLEGRSEGELSGLRLFQTLRECLIEALVSDPVDLDADGLM